MNFTTIKEVEQALALLRPTDSLITRRDITTERTFALAALVNNPQQQLRVVHVAGTSGKTSTTYYIARLLTAAGIKTGLTVSPHITSITERVQINGRPLPDATFCAYMSEFLPLVVTDEEDLPSYFEVMMVFALWVFAREKVDYAVIETGLGGLHDSSNICRRADKLCVITDIGIDHTHILGSTIKAIAAQKVGIIAPGNTVVMYRQGRAVMDVVRRQVARQGSTLTVLSGEHADYQDRNFALALFAYAQLVRRDGLPLLGETVLQQIRQRQIPGRLEVISRRGVQIVRDGAHNEQKMYALVKTLKARYPGRKWAVVLAMKQGKDYETVMATLAPIMQRAVVTQFHLSQDAPIVSIEPGTLAHEFAAYGIEAVEQPTVSAAVDLLIDEKEPHILVTGSLYMMGEI